MGDHVADTLPELWRELLARTKRERLSMDGYVCARCGEEAEIAAYVWYSSGLGIENLESLCERCHDRQHI